MSSQAMKKHGGNKYILLSERIRSEKGYILFDSNHNGILEKTKPQRW
jgi:hypothetical protein